MSIPFISPASVELTQSIVAWRRQPQVQIGFRELSARQVAELRWPLAEIAVREVTVCRLAPMAVIARDLRAPASR